MIAVLAGAKIMQAGGQPFGLRQRQAARVIFVQLGIELTRPDLRPSISLYQRIEHIGRLFVLLVIVQQIGKIDASENGSVR